MHNLYIEYYHWPNSLWLKCNDLLPIDYMSISFVNYDERIYPVASLCISIPTISIQESIGSRILRLLIWERISGNCSIHGISFRCYI